MIHERCQSCAYRETSHYGFSGSCCYIQITGESRLKKVYKRLGVHEITDEVREAMRPENCQCFVPGPKRPIEDRHDIVLPGSMPKKKQTPPTVWPETQKLGETR